MLGFLLASCSTPTELPPAPAEPAAAPPPPAMALSPEASIATMQIATMQLPKGYRLEPVLTEPHIAEPVMVAFDGNGRMYVAEMRTYMLDADGTGEQEPVSRVSRHEDTDGDGVYDRHTVFADKLLLPRIMLPLDDRIIIGETNTDDLYIYRDSNGDGVADEKTLWFKGGPRGGNMEHQPNGLVWAMDNGIYSTYYDYRLRFGADGKAMKESIPVNGGQWGLTQDDWGKVWFVNAGNETGPVHFQQHIIYGQFSAPNEHIGQYKVVWPIARIPDTQGGPGQLRPDNTLNHFTATCGQDIFRGDRLPAELRGNLLFAEPVGRLDPPHADHGRGWRHPPGQRLRRSAQRIHPRDRSAVPPRQHDHRARRHSLYRRHVSRHHPAGQLDPQRHVPARTDRGPRSAKGDRPRPHLSPASREFRARPATAHARRNSGRVGAAPVPSQWLVARHRAETPRPASRSLGRARARETCELATPPIPARACMRCGRSTVSARSMTNSSCAR